MGLGACAKSPGVNEAEGFPWIRGRSRDGSSDSAHSDRIATILGEHYPAWRGARITQLDVLTWLKAERDARIDRPGWYAGCFRLHEGRVTPNISSIGNDDGVQK